MNLTRTLPAALLLAQEMARSAAHVRPRGFPLFAP